LSIKLPTWETKIIFIHPSNYAAAHSSEHYYLNKKWHQNKGRKLRGVGGNPVFYYKYLVIEVTTPTETAEIILG